MRFPDTHIAYHALRDAGWTRLASTTGKTGREDHHHGH
ncbi:hypothetical protein ARZXY2_4652 (plasmid) [Arthrobacter sp. ZXY-2]|nr:hypothetical protein ARZXY2_4652 [Arthrobacter sp. ZXY-2]